MSNPDGALNKVKSTEEIINRIYATAFRLTGEGKDAEAIVTEAVNTLISKQEKLTIQTALKGLCAAFLKVPYRYPQRHFLFIKGTFSGGTISTEQVQEALLCLEPKERLVLVLREMWRFSYGEIADLTGMGDRDKVAGVLARGRQSLRNCFFPPDIKWDKGTDPLYRTKNCTK